MSVTTEPDVAPAAAARSRAGRIGFILLVFALSRGMLVLCGVIAIDAIARKGVGLAELADLFVRWDSLWYLRIVEHGYSPVWTASEAGMTSYAFFPFYPMLVRAAVWATGLPAAAGGLIVSNLAFLAALFLVMRYCEERGLSIRAERAVVVLLCFVPGSHAFSAVYTESTFLLLLAATMLAVRRGAFWTAAATAACLSATRSVGICVAVFAFAAIVERHGRDWLGAVLRDPRALLPIAFAPVGLVCFWWYCWATSGDAFAQMTTARYGWGWIAVPPGTGLWYGMASGSLVGIFFSVASLAAAAMIVALLRRRMWAEAALCIACFALYWSGLTVNALLRYAVVLFPLGMPVARMVDDRPLLFAGIVGALATLEGALMIAWTLERFIAI